jgi:hypothetical protein
MAEMTCDLSTAGKSSRLFVESGPLSVSGSLNTVHIYIGAGATLEIDGPSSADITFQAGKGRLRLKAPMAFNGNILSAGLENTIDLGGISVTGFTYDGSTLTVSETNGQKFNLAVSANTAGNGHGGTDASWWGPIPPTVTVTSLAATPAGGMVQVDSTITITVTFSGDVIVTGGTPVLTLNDGGVAVYSGGSGTNTLTFTYKVAVNDRSLPDLAVTGLTNGAAIVDAKSRKPANASLASKTFAGLGIDTLTPVITQIRSLRSQFYF